jgi:hypothetical protein
VVWCFVIGKQFTLLRQFWYVGVALVFQPVHQLLDADDQRLVGAGLATKTQ